MDYNKVLDALAASIIDTVKRLIEMAKFDRTSIGVVNAVSGHSYTVNAFGGQYTIQSAMNFVVGDSVVVMAPQNNFNCLIILGGNSNGK